jgi:aconitase A
MRRWLADHDHTGSRQLEYSCVTCVGGWMQEELHAERKETVKATLSFGLEKA